MSRIVVLGGGIAGLSTAYFLAKAGMKPIVLEKEKEAGGLGFCHSVGDMFIDSGYHIIFKGDEYLLNLLRELNLEKDIVWGDLDFKLVTKKGDIFFSPLKILSSICLSLSEKKFLAKIYFKMKNTKDWKSLDKFTAKEWIIKNSSGDVYKDIFEPIIKAKWGRDSDKASAAWFYGRLKPRSKSRNIFGGGEKAGYLKGSFKNLFSVLEREIKGRGGEIITSAKPTRISIKNKKVVSVKYRINKNLKEMRTDTLISTIPVGELLRIAKLPEDFERQARKLKYKAVICAVFSLRKKVTNSFRTIFSERRSFGGLVELTNLIDKKHFGGKHILYVFNFLNAEESLWKLGDKEIIERYMNDLERLYSSFKEQIIWYRLYKNQYGEPFYQKDYLNIMPDTKTPVKGLFLTGMIHSYPVSDFNNIVSLASKTADLVLREVRC